LQGSLAGLQVYGGLSSMELTVTSIRILGLPNC